MNENQSIMLASLVVSNEFQTRMEMNEDAIADYADAIRNAGCWPFPPIKVVRQVLVDGFHRIEATRRVIAGPETPKDLRKSLLSVPCERVDVDPANHDITVLAMQHALAANQTHGLRRTTADKRRSVELALEHWSNESDRQIALLTGTTHPFVAKVRRGLQVETLPPQPTVSSCDSAAKLETLPLEPGPVSVPSHPLEVETLPPEPIPSSATTGLNEEVETLPPEKQRVSGSSEAHTANPDESAKRIKALAHKHRDKLVCLIDDYGRLKRNHSEQLRLVRLVQSVSLW